MNSHELARLLLSHPDLPIVAHANNHTYVEPEDTVVGFLESYNGQSICIGNMSKKNINKPNWYVTDMISGDIPDEWWAPEHRVWWK